MNPLVGILEAARVHLEVVAESVRLSLVCRDLGDDGRALYWALDQYNNGDAPYAVSRDALE